MRIVKNLLILMLTLSSSASSVVTACTPLTDCSRGNYVAPRYAVPAPRVQRLRPTVVPAPAAVAKPQATSLRANPVYVVCTQDADGQWWLRSTTKSRAAAQQLKAQFESQGVRAWEMEAIPLPEGKSFSMANGEVAIALAISLGKDAHAVAIGPSGRAEALASK